LHSVSFTSLVFLNSMYIMRIEALELKTLVF
jgi:hypothetical protein